MKAMFWRELAQHFRWVWPVPLVFLGAMSLEALAPAKHVSLTSSSFTTVVFYGFPLYGAVLGFVQFFAHARGGAREVLLHRPVRILSLFNGKVAAGLTLYAYGAGLPFLATTGWCALSPRPHFPFGWELCLPGLIDLLGGTIFYFAGSLVAQRDVRWHGGRLLPLAGAVLAVLCGYGVSASLAIVIHVVALACLATAARVAFVRGDPAERPVGRLALAAVLLAGISLAGGAVMFLVGPAVSVDRPAWQWCWVSNAGELLRSDWQADRHVDVVALGGLRRETERSLGFVSRSERAALAAPEEYLRVGSSAHLARSRWYRSNRVYTQVFDSPGAHWYFDHRSRVLRGYDTETGALVGLLGPEGRRDVGEAAPAPFVGRLLHSADDSVLTTEGAIYRIDEEGESMSLFYEATAERPIRHLRWRRRDGGGLLQAGDRLLRLDGRGIVLMDTAFAGGGSTESARLYDRGEAGAIVIYAAEEGRGPRTDLVTWLDPRGVETGRREISVLRERSALSATGNLLAGLLVPPAYRVAWPSVRRLLGLRAPVWFGAVEAGPLRRFGALLASLGSALSALLILRGRGLATAATTAWVLAGLLFGPAGLVLLAVLQPLPVREPCACGSLRRVDEAACSSCGASWPEPTLDGTEILA